LYTQAIENIGYQHPHDITMADRQALQSLLA